MSGSVKDSEKYKAEEGITKHPGFIGRGILTAE